MGSNDSTPFAGDKLAGIDFAATSTSAEHTLGTIARDNSGGTYMYVVAGAAIAVYIPCKLATGFSATPSGNAGLVVGVAQTAIASGSYGWIQISGECTAHVTDAQAAGVVLLPYTDANGDLTTVAAATDGVRGVQLVTEDATDYVSVYLF